MTIPYFQLGMRRCDYEVLRIALDAMDVMQETPRGLLLPKPGREYCQCLSCVVNKLAKENGCDDTWQHEIHPWRVMCGAVQLPQDRGESARDYEIRWLQGVISGLLG